MNKRKHVDVSSESTNKRVAIDQGHLFDDVRVVLDQDDLLVSFPSSLPTPIDCDRDASCSRPSASIERDLVIFNRSYSAQSPPPTPVSPYPIPISELGDTTDIEELNPGSFHDMKLRQKRGVLARSEALFTKVQLFGDRHLAASTPIEQALQNMRNLIQDHVKVSDRDHPTLWKVAGRIVVDLSDAETHLRAGDVDEAMLSYDRVLARTTMSAEKPGLALLQLISHLFSWSTYPQYTALVTGLLSFLMELKGPHYNSILRLVAMSLSDRSQSPAVVKIILQRCMADYLSSTFGEDSPMVLWTKIRLSRYLVAARERSEAITVLDSVHTLHTSCYDIDSFLHAEVARELGTTYWWLSNDVDPISEKTQSGNQATSLFLNPDQNIKKQSTRFLRLARTHLGTALAFYNTNKGAFTFRRAYVLNRLAYCHYMLDDQYQALVFAQEAVELFKASCETDKPQLRAAQELFNFIEKTMECPRDVNALFEKVFNQEERLALNADYATTLHRSQLKVIPRKAGQLTQSRLVQDTLGNLAADVKDSYPSTAVPVPYLLASTNSRQDLQKNDLLQDQETSRGYARAASAGNPIFVAQSDGAHISLLGSSLHGEQPASTRVSSVKRLESARTQEEKTVRRVGLYESGHSLTEKKSQRLSETDRRKEDLRHLGRPRPNTRLTDQLRTKQDHQPEIPTPQSYHSTMYGSKNFPSSLLYNSVSYTMDPATSSYGNTCYFNTMHNRRFQVPRYVDRPTTLSNTFTMKSPNQPYVENRASAPPSLPPASHPDNDNGTSRCDYHELRTNLTASTSGRSGVEKQRPLPPFHQCDHIDTPLEVRKESRGVLNPRWAVPETARFCTDEIPLPGLPLESAFGMDPRHGFPEQLFS